MPNPPAKILPNNFPGRSLQQNPLRILQFERFLTMKGCPSAEPMKFGSPIFQAIGL